MTEPMTTDQRVALALTTTMQQSAVVSQTFAALTGSDIAPELARPAERQVETQTDIGARLLELSEALAADRVRIVDEGELVRELSRVFRGKLIMGRGGSGGEPASQLREAQHFLSRLKGAGVL